MQNGSSPSTNAVSVSQETMEGSHQMLESEKEPCAQQEVLFPPKVCPSSSFGKFRKTQALQRVAGLK